MGLQLELSAYARKQSRALKEELKEPNVPLPRNTIRSDRKKRDFEVKPNFKSFLNAVKAMNESTRDDQAGGRIFFDAPEKDKLYYIYFDDLVFINDSAGTDKMNYGAKYSIVAPKANVVFVPSKEYAPKSEGLIQSSNRADVWFYGITFANSTVYSDKLVKRQYRKDEKDFTDPPSQQQKNDVAYYSGAAYRQKRGPDNGNPVTFMRCNFKNNHVVSSEARGGGAISIYGTNLEFWECCFHNNSGAAGGAIAGKKFSLHVFGCDFFNNFATGGRDEKTEQHVGNGGAIRADGVLNGRIAGCQFVGNYIEQIQKMRGTAMTLYGDAEASGDLIVEGCFFYRNGQRGSSMTESCVNMEGSLTVMCRNNNFEENRNQADLESCGIISLRSNGKGNKVVAKDLNLHRNQLGQKGFAIKIKRGDEPPLIARCNVDNQLVDRILQQRAIK